MRVPTLEGVIRRRILVNYRVDPSVAERLLPARFRPKLYRGHAIAGICLIRLEHLRPRGLPAWIGMASENVAHRVAVTWRGSAGIPREGVYIPRRDSSSRINQWAGGVVFPGVHHRAKFDIDDNGSEVALRVEAVDGTMSVELSGKSSAMLPSNSIFGSLHASSEFFSAGSLGYSPTHNSCRFDGLQLEVADWHVEPFAVAHLASRFFGDQLRFPQGSVEFDHALIMRDVAHLWRGTEDLGDC